MEEGQKIIALAGNPNVGKSTIFNGLTGLKQHTGRLVLVVKRTIRRAQNPDTRLKYKNCYEMLRNCIETARNCNELLI